MSDGNFNRALLPHTPFANGLQIGRKQGLQIALQAFESFLRKEMPELSDEQVAQKREAFASYLKR
ncbi:MAG: hypothetical protein HUK01_00180 [Bacteroidaceae bacterium]|nr:hypothetical protein [Bacteroidaceae bacterium]